MGQISHYPALSACQRCLEKGVQCIKLIVLTWSVDCESGNRKMADLVNGEHTQFLDLLLVVPDAVHLGKTYKCSWSNWFLLLGEGDRSTLGTLRTLRNDCNITVRETLHKLLSAESVRNKDRMAVEPLLELTSEKLIAFLGVIENVFVTVTLLPDRYRISETNKRGLYEHPFAICTASTGKIFFLNWKTNTGSSDLVQLRLHSAADSKVEAVGISLCYMQSVALFCGKKGIR